MKGLEAQNAQTTESALLTTTPSPAPSKEGFTDILGFVFYILINLASIRHTHTHTQEDTMQKVQRP